MGLAKFVLRTTVGGTIMAHGLQKLNGSFGGSGLRATEKTMESLGLHPPKYQAWAAALSETIGGGLTAAGFLSPLGPSMIIGSQVVAINKVHQKNGFWSHKGGYEYNVALISAAFALAEMGPGAFSLDRLFGKRRSGFGWALAGAGLAIGAAAATLQLSERLAPTKAEIGPAEANGAEKADDRDASWEDARGKGTQGAGTGGAGAGGAGAGAGGSSGGTNGLSGNGPTASGAGSSSAGAFGADRQDSPGDSSGGAGITQTPSGSGAPAPPPGSGGGQS